LRESFDSPRNNNVAQTAAERLTITSGSDFSRACIHSNTWTYSNIDKDFHLPRYVSCVSQSSTLYWH